MSITRRVWEALPRKFRRELLFGGIQHYPASARPELDRLLAPDRYAWRVPQPQPRSATREHGHMAWIDAVYRQHDNRHGQQQPGPADTEQKPTLGSRHPNREHKTGQRENEELAREI